MGPEAVEPAETLRVALSRVQVMLRAKSTATVASPEGAVDLPLLVEVADNKMIVFCSSAEMR